VTGRAAPRDNGADGFSNVKAERKKKSTPCVFTCALGGGMTLHRFPPEDCQLDVGISWGLAFIIFADLGGSDNFAALGGSDGLAIFVAFEAAELTLSNFHTAVSS
jgi:hypothetical protein